MQTVYRARVAFLIAIVSLIVAGFAGTGLSASERSERSGGSPPAAADDAATGICAAPEDGGGSDGNIGSSGCDDTIEDPVVDDDVVGDGNAARLVEPTPGMADVRPHIFDHVVASDDGTSLTIFFWSGVEPCYVLDHVDVENGAGAVTITLFEGHDASAGDVACIEIALLKKVVVELEEPLGDRRIVDGAA